MADAAAPPADGDAAAAAAYCAAALRCAPACAPLLRHLLRLHVCPRCALRFACVRGDAYAARAPSGAAMARALDVLAPPEAAEDAAGAADDAAGAAAAAAEEPVCPSCWGALQRADAPAGDAAACGEARGAGPARVGAGCGSAAALAAALRASGYAAAPFSLDVSPLPALLLRQAAQLAQLRAGGSLRPPAAPTPLREALRASLGPLLAAAAAQPLAPAAGPLRLAMTYTHPDAAAEVAFLRLPQPQHAGSGGNKHWGGRGRGGRGGRGGGRSSAPPATTSASTATEAAAAADALCNAATRALGALTDADLLAYCAAPFAPPARGAAATLTLSRDIIYVGGYYTKALRGVSQTPWLVDGGDVGDGSVQDDIEAVLLPLLRAESAKFLSAGREDMDVRMLGGGRPFVVEAINARAPPPDAAALAAAAAALAARGRVGVRALAVLTRQERERMREGEAEKSKAYRAVVSLSRPFTPADAAALAAAAASGIVLRQQTPVRVLHRRAALTRERAVHALAATPLPGHPRALILELRCGAGTYVKEFIHGDFGRTQPCLPDLLAPDAPRAAADCLQLDVTSVEMEWL